MQKSGVFLNYITALGKGAAKKTWVLLARGTVYIK
jgi:hypothetical protein